MQPLDSVVSRIKKINKQSKISQIHTFKALFHTSALGIIQQYDISSSIVLRGVL
jgi:hypothetical protein